MDVKDIEIKMGDICTIKDTLVNAAKTHISQGIDQVNTKELGEVIDMIKDLSETEKNCHEACYYAKVSHAMEEKQDDYEGARYGYPNKNSRMPLKEWERPYMDQEPYIREYLNDIDDFDENPRMGYPMNVGRNHYRSSSTGRYVDSPRHGEAYNQYQRSRRGYMETKSEKDKEEMHMHAQEHVADTIATIRDIWRNADPELKKRMKADFQSLINEMQI